MGHGIAKSKLFLGKLTAASQNMLSQPNASSREILPPMKTAAARRATASVHFRSEIEKAEADGVAREDMTLRLTLNDVNQLRRDQSLPVADLSFAGGVMRYLGVKVEQGGVSASTLNRDE
jgi:hypothetical protein